MRRLLALILVLPVWSQVAAQDLAITNAQIVDGTGSVIGNGSIVVRSGRISSVSDAQIADPPAIELDVQGMTVLPGFIDSHTHLLISERMALDGEAALSQWIDEELPGHLEDYLESGVTTVLSHGDYFPAIVDVKRLVERGGLRGPRLLASGPFLTTTGGHPVSMLCAGAAPFCRASMMAEVDTPEAARTVVRELAEAGVDAIKVVYDDGLRPDPYPELTDTTLSAIVDEARQRNLPVIAHAREIVDALKVIDYGVARLAHPPVLGSGDLAAVGPALVNSSVPFPTTSNWGLDGVRMLWDAGATVAIGTDGFGARGPGVAIAREIAAVAQILAPAEIVAALTRHGAAYVGLGDEIGTLEVGKLADIVVIDGDPLADPEAFANVAVVVQGGRIVVDNR